MQDHIIPIMKRMGLRTQTGELVRHLVGQIVRDRLFESERLDFFCGTTGHDVEAPIRLQTTAIRYELQGYSWVSGFDRRRTGAKSPSMIGGSRPSSLYFAFKSSSVGMLTVTV